MSIRAKVRKAEEKTSHRGQTPGEQWQLKSEQTCSWDFYNIKQNNTFKDVLNQFTSKTEFEKLFSFSEHLILCNHLWLIL